MYAQLCVLKVYAAQHVCPMVLAYILICTRSGATATSKSTMVLAVVASAWHGVQMWCDVVGPSGCVVMATASDCGLMSTCCGVLELWPTWISKKAMRKRFLDLPAAV